MKKNILIIAMFVFGTMAYAQTFVSTTPSTKKVLIEEFTGINCGWCPDGHRIVNELMAAHPGSVFGINIHAGGYAANTYTTTDGEYIRANWNVSSFPSGMVNRTIYAGTSPVYGRNYFTTYTNSQIVQPAIVNIAAHCTIDCATRVLTVDVEAFYTDSSTAANNFLQVALLQDNILGPQGGASLNPDQVINGQYNHMHMFRANITGNTWGDTIYTTDSGSFVSKTYTYNLPATISGVNVLPFDLEVLAFITESKTDVLNVCKADIAYENASASVISMNPLDFEGCDMEFPTFVTVYNPLEDTVRSLDIKYGIHGSSSATCTRTGIMILPNQRDTFHLPMLIGNYNSGTDYAGYAKVTSVNGTSVNSDSLNCSLLKNSKNAAGHMLTFRLTTDRYGSETTYKFMKNDGTVLSSGGPYTNSVQTYNIALIVPEDGCYRLEVYDSEGDGINGGYGNGSFSLSDNNGLVFTDNGQFTAKSQYFLNITHTDGLMGAQLVDFSLYPNPVKNTLHIECGQDIEKAEIFDMQGKMVLSQENANDINVSILAKGSYILRVATKDGAAVHSFVKE